MKPMRNDCLIYMAGPISKNMHGGPEYHAARALPVYLELIRAGVPCFCPQITGAFPSAHQEVPYERWIDYSYAMISRATHMLMLEGWGWSRGACMERDYALRQGVKVFYSVQDLLAWLAVN